MIVAPFHQVSDSHLTTPTDTPSLGSVERPLVLVVLPRIVDLVIQQDRSLAPALFSQRRPSYALRRERLLEIVDIDELGLDERVRLPPEVILVAQARQLWLGGRGVPRGMRTWRLAYSALCLLRLHEAASAGRLTMARVHQCIDVIGRETFTEIESVLQRELRLFEDDDLVRIYGEFVTLHAELRAFAPQSLDAYFPSLAGRHEEMAVLGEEDLAAAENLDLTRPEGVTLPSATASSEAELAATEDEVLAKPLPSLRPIPSAMLV